MQLKMSNFCKHEDCPPSLELLAFQNGDIEVSDSGHIRRHLAVCEFCAAEVEFYGHYPPADEKVEPEKMPEPLHDLAEALLRGERDMSSIYKLMKDSD
jgi:hypothetical protein